MNNKKENSFKRTLKFVYLKLARINDSPQRVALGLGLGVFLGLFPGTGPIAALFFAVLLRLNRAAALLGSLLTNTWLSLVTFLLAVKTGSIVMGLDWRLVYQDTLNLIKGFHWADLLKLSALKLILPILIGYCVVGLVLALGVYLVALWVLQRRQQRRKVCSP